MSETNAEGQHPREGAATGSDEGDYVGPVDHGQQEPDSVENGEPEDELESEGNLGERAERPGREAGSKEEHHDER